MGKGASDHYARARSLPKPRLDSLLFVGSMLAQHITWTSVRAWHFSSQKLVQ